MPLTNPACSRALTGEGPSATSGNHRWAGTRALRTAPASTNRVATRASSMVVAPAVAWASASTFKVPRRRPQTATAVQSRKSPSISRLRTDRAAARARGVLACATSALMASPAVVQPTASTGSDEASTTSESPNTTVHSRAAKRAGRAWPVRLRCAYTATTAAMEVISTSSTADRRLALRPMVALPKGSSATRGPPVAMGPLTTTATRVATAAAAARERATRATRRDFIRNKIHEILFTYKNACLLSFRRTYAQRWWNG